MRRGEIYYVRRSYAEVGSEIHTGRPAVIVSNDSLNDNAGVVEVVFLTTAPKKPMRTHVEITGSGVKSTALCEQISSISTERIGDYVGKCSDEEMLWIEDAMMASLDIPFSNSKQDVVGIDSSEFFAVASERDMYKRMYDDLLSKVLRR